MLIKSIQAEFQILQNDLDEVNYQTEKLKLENKELREFVEKIAKRDFGTWSAKSLSESAKNILKK